MQHLEVSGAVRPLYWSLGVKGLTPAFCRTLRDRSSVRREPRVLLPMPQQIRTVCRPFRKTAKRDF